jgi:hypothetical protein
MHCSWYFKTSWLKELQKGDLKFEELENCTALVISAS